MTAEDAINLATPIVSSAPSASPSPRHRGFPRTGSPSTTSSIVTVQRLPQLHPSSIANGLRSSTVPPSAILDSRAADTAREVNNPSEGRSGHSRRRSSIAHVARESFRGKPEGVENFNRWSHSSVSSRSSLQNEKRNSFSLRLSVSATGDIISSTQVQVQPAPFAHASDAFHQPYPTASPEKRPSTARSVFGQPRPATELPPIETLPSLAQTVYDSDARSASTSNPTPSTGGGAQPLPYSFSPPDNSGRISFNAPRNHIHSPTRPQVTRNVTAPLSPSSFARKSQHQHIRNEAHVAMQQSGPLRSPPSAASESRESRKRSNHERRSGSRDKIIFGYHAHSRSTSSGNSHHHGIAGTTPPRTRERRERDKKVMLSRALQKANMAVKLDHVQNFEGAIEAYEDACRLLHQVLERSSGDEDKRKLASIVSEFQ